MKIQKIIFISGFLLAGSLTISSCYRDKEELLYGSDCSNPSVQPGAKFTAVQNLVNQECVGCHSPSGGTSPDLSTKCLIVQKWSSIHEVCVSAKTMPPGGPLSASDQQLITDWVNAGHRYTD